MVKPYLLQSLKELALLGAVHNKIEISSLELAKQLQTSQQTASRYLLELDETGLVTREIGIKKQLILLTEPGIEALQDEFSQYKQIFDLETKVHFKGIILSGMGEGKYYTAQQNYVDQFKQHLGFQPYPGTLNVEIKPIERNKLRILRQYGGVLIEEFQTKNRTFGGVRCYPATVNGIQAAIVIPTRSHYSTVLEIISPEFLRKVLKVNDGDQVDVVVHIDK